MNRGILAAMALAAACSGSRDADTTPPPLEPPPDRTPPSVVSRYPAPGDFGLASGPYRVVFSEPLDPATIQSSTVHVWQATGQVLAALALSDGGKVLTITPVLAPRIPGFVFVELTGAMKDLAGNSLALPATPWTFDLATWVQPGGPGPISSAEGPNPIPSLALDADDQPVVGMANLFPDPVVRFDGATWSPLPTPPSFTIHSWIAGDGQGGLWHGEVNFGMGQVNRLDGSSWTRIGEYMPQSNPNAYQYDARVVVRAGVPVLLWNEWVPPDAPGGPATSLQVRGWGGAAWTPWADEPGPALWPTMGMGPTGAIVASWRENADARVAWVTPVGLERIPALPNTGIVDGLSAVTTDLDGNPVVAFGEGDGLSTAIRVKVWTGSAWQQVGGDVSLAVRSVSTPALAMGADGHPFVAWTEGPTDARKLYLARFDGSSWVRLGGPLNVDPDHDVYQVALALDRRGAPVLAWPEATGEVRYYGGPDPYPIYRFQVKRLNR